MLKLLFLIFIVLFSACRSKYDTSKAVNILSSEEILPDYRLKDVPLKVEDTSQIVDINEYKSESVQNLSIPLKDVKYHNGFLYTTSNKKASFIEMDTLQTIEVKHNIYNPKITIGENFILLYNVSGKFSFIDLQTHKELWSDSVETQGLASDFTCINDKCYAMALSGDVISLELDRYTKEQKPLFEKQSIVLNQIYEPLLADDKIIFAVGNSEFAIFNTTTQQVVAQSSFVDDSNTSMFDINLVKAFYKGEDRIIISHINGSYAFNMLYGRPLWAKNFVFSNAFVSNNYAIFFEEKTQKLMSIHLETGEVKWMQDIDFEPLEIDINYEKKLIIVAKDGVHLFELETGEVLSFKKINMHEVDYSFVHNHKIYYIGGKKIYKIQ